MILPHPKPRLDMSTVYISKGILNLHNHITLSFTLHFETKQSLDIQRENGFMEKFLLPNIYLKKSKMSESCEKRTHSFYSVLLNVSVSMNS